MEEARKGPKVTIEFDAEEHREELQMAMSARDMNLLLWDLDQMLRSTEKHEAPLADLPAHVNGEMVSYPLSEVAHHLRAWLSQEMQERCIRFPS
jgi:phosphoserine phosphatase